MKSMHKNVLAQAAPIPHFLAFLNARDKKIYKKTTTKEKRDVYRAALLSHEKGVAYKALKAAASKSFVDAPSFIKENAANLLKLRPVLIKAAQTDVPDIITSPEDELDTIVLVIIFSGEGFTTRLVIPPPPGKDEESKVSEDGQSTGNNSQSKIKGKTVAPGPYSTQYYLTVEADGSYKFQSVTTLDGTGAPTGCFKIDKNFKVTGRISDLCDWFLSSKEGNTDVQDVATETWPGGIIDANFHYVFLHHSLGKTLMEVASRVLSDQLSDLIGSPIVVEPTSLAEYKELGNAAAKTFETLSKKYPKAPGSGGGKKLNSLLKGAKGGKKGVNDGSSEDDDDKNTNSVEDDGESNNNNNKGQDKNKGSSDFTIANTLSNGMRFSAGGGVIPFEKETFVPRSTNTIVKGAQITVFNIVVDFNKTPDFLVDFFEKGYEHAKRGVCSQSALTTLAELTLQRIGGLLVTGDDEGTNSNSELLKRKQVLRHAMQIVYFVVGDITSQLVFVGHAHKVFTEVMMHARAHSNRHLALAQGLKAVFGVHINVALRAASILNAAVAQIQKALRSNDCEDEDEFWKKLDTTYGNITSGTYQELKRYLADSHPLLIYFLVLIASFGRVFHNICLNTSISVEHMLVELRQSCVFIHRSVTGHKMNTDDVKAFEAEAAFVGLKPTAAFSHKIDHSMDAYEGYITHSVAHDSLNYMFNDAQWKMVGWVGFVPKRDSSSQKGKDVEVNNQAGQRRDNSGSGGMQAPKNDADAKERAKKAAEAADKAKKDRTDLTTFRTGHADFARRNKTVTGLWKGTEVKCIFHGVVANHDSATCHWWKDMSKEDKATLRLNFNDHIFPQ